MKRTALAAFATLALALPCAALPLGLRLAARRAAVEAQSRAETPEERAYRIYAPNTAFEVTVTNGHTYTLYVRGWIYGTAVADRWVDWGDGARDAGFTGGGYPSHTYERAGSYVVQVSDALQGFQANGGSWAGKEESFPVVTAALRYGDSLTSAAWAYLGCTNIVGFLPRWGKSVTDASLCYSVKKPIHGIPAWNDKITNAAGTYSNCIGLTGEIPAWNDKITSADDTYSYCSGLTGSIPAWNDKITNAQKTYFTCSGLTGSIPAWNDKITNAMATFSRCPGLTGDIPKWGAAITTTGIESFWCGTYADCTGLTGAWTDDPDELMPTNITSHDRTVRGCSDSLRALFYSDWGGTRTKPATE